MLNLLAKYLEKALIFAQRKVVQIGHKGVRVFLLEIPFPVFASLELLILYDAKSFSRMD